MKEVIIRFATLNAQNVIAYVFVALAVVWVVMVMTALFSIAKQKLPGARKMMWTFVVVLLPGIGMALYCFRCLLTAEYPLLQQLGFTGGARSVPAYGQQKN